MVRNFLWLDFRDSLLSQAYFRIHLKQARDVTSHVATRKTPYLRRLRIPILVCGKFLAPPGIKTLLYIKNGFIFLVVCPGYVPCLNMLEQSQDGLTVVMLGLEVNFLINLQSFSSKIFSASKLVTPLANSFQMFLRSV